MELNLNTSDSRAEEADAEDLKGVGGTVALHRPRCEETQPLLHACLLLRARDAFCLFI